MPEYTSTNSSNSAGRDAKRELLAKLCSLIIDCRQRRQSIEQEWLNNHAAYMGKAVRQQYQSTLFSYNPPMARRSIERTVIRAKKILLPRPHFFEVSPANEFDIANSRQGDAVRAYLHYLNRKRIKVPKLVGELTRNLLLYTTSTVKTTVGVYDSGGLSEIWPRSRAVDPFCYYVFPETALDPEDRVTVFEDHMMPWGEYQGKADQGIVEPIQRSELSKPVWPTHHITRLNHQGLSEPTEAPKMLEQFVALTEVWFKAGIRWLQCWIVWNIDEGPRMVLGPRASAYGLPPYEDAIARPLVGQLYTHSQMHDVEPFQVWLTDAVNQMEESRVISSLPPVAVDPNTVGRKDALVYGPRRIWPINPKDVQTINVPDTSGGALRVMQVILSLADNMTGSSSLGEGKPGRNMPRAGFAVNNLLSLQMVDTEEIAQIIGQENLEPMLASQYRLTKTFVPPSQIFKIPGTQDFPPFTVSAAELAGEYNFEWVTSVSGQEGDMRAQKLISFGQLILPLIPYLQQQGVTVDLAAFVRTIWREGLGERGLNQIVRQLTPQEQQVLMMQMMAQQKPAAGGQPQQAAGGAEDFERQMAAMLSQMQGA